MRVGKGFKAELGGGGGTNILICIQSACCVLIFSPLFLHMPQVGWGIKSS